MTTLTATATVRTVCTGDVWRGLLAWAGRAAVGILLLFHAWLLWAHATSGKLFEADVALRWAIAGFLALGFWSLRRFGLPLFRGRRAVVLWLLVVLLHGHAIWTGDAGQVLPVTVPQAAVDLVPAGLQLAATLSAVLLVAWLTARAAATGLRSCQAAPRPRPFGLPVAVATLRFAPRPPPQF
jgi:hypothetical protein